MNHEFRFVGKRKESLLFWKEILEVGVLRFRILGGFQDSEKNGGLAQLARAPALHAGGHRFDSDILHAFD